MDATDRFYEQLRELCDRFSNEIENETMQELLVDVTFELHLAALDEAESQGAETREVDADDSANACSQVDSSNGEE